MDEQKKNRIVAAVTVNVILLIFFLAVVAVYTLAETVTKMKYAKELKEEIKRYQQLTENEEDYLEKLQSEEHLLYLALKNGYVYKSE